MISCFLIICFIILQASFFNQIYITVIFFSIQPKGQSLWAFWGIQLPLVLYSMILIKHLIRYCWASIPLRPLALIWFLAATSRQMRKTNPYWSSLINFSKHRRPIMSVAYETIMVRWLQFRWQQIYVTICWPWIVTLAVRKRDLKEKKILFS